MHAKREPVSPYALERRRDQRRFVARLFVLVCIIGGSIWLGWYSPWARNAGPPSVEVAR